MSEQTVGQRLKILISELGLDVRSFCKALDVSETTVRNYFNRGSNPNAEFLMKLTNTFDQVNLSWLLSAKGSPVINNGDSSSVASDIAGEKNTVTNIGKSVGATLNITSLDSCKAELVQAIGELKTLRSQLDAAQTVIEAKDTVIAAKDETINLLRGNYNRPH